MRQWELRGITDDHDPTGIELESRARDGEATLVVEEAFPTVLWTTDRSLGFTSGPPPGILSIDLPLDPSDGDLFDLSGSEELGGMEVIEAHLAALRGTPGRFRIRERGRELQCVVWPAPGEDGQVAGTICVATGSEAIRVQRTIDAVSRAELSSRSVSGSPRAVESVHSS
ncbi:MAG: hypothetical protein WD556_00500 [Actinomycetota bacterium]